MNTMGEEHERKWLLLVTSDFMKALEDCQRYTIEQFYLLTRAMQNDDHEIRYRKLVDRSGQTKYKRTEKIGTGMSRIENENIVSNLEYEFLKFGVFTEARLQEGKIDSAILCEYITGIIKKIRWEYISADGLIYEIDLYHQPLLPQHRVVLEIEFESMCDARQYNPKNIHREFGDNLRAIHEVTGMPQYANSYIAQHGFPDRLPI